jgi:menaquinone-specific isochorismate synthase
MTEVTVQAPPLHARTVAGADRGEELEGFRFEWSHDGRGFVASGIAAHVAARDVTARLAEARVDDEVDRPGTGAIAVGALTFVDAAAAGLVVPRRVTGYERDGTTWTTAIVSPGRSEEPLARLDPPAGPGHATVRDRSGPAEFEAAVAAALAEIAAGTLTKVVLTRTLELLTESDIDPRWLLDRLRDREPGRYLYATPDIVGASPELLVERRGHTVTSRPLAGSWPADRPDAVAILTASAKDREEHRYVVEAVERSLRAVCDGVHVGETRPTSLPDVVHLATTISAEAGPRTPSALDLALLLHPTPAVGGTPGEAAEDFIARHEPARHHYAAPVGWVDADGDGQFAVALRNAELVGPRRALVRAGAGIVAGSDPATEWREIDAKLAPALHAFS